jgi:hypothetical protein
VIELSVPSAATLKAEMVPLFAVGLCAFETYSWEGLVGLNSLPKGPAPSGCSEVPRGTEIGRAHEQCIR